MRDLRPGPPRCAARHGQHPRHLPHLLPGTRDQLLGLRTTALGRRSTAAGRPLCFRCQAIRRIDETLTGPDSTIPPALAPVREAILATDNPRSILNNLARNKGIGLLRDIATGRRPLSHAMLDEHRGAFSAEHLRALLVACAALPDRDERTARLRRFVDEHVAHLNEPDHRRVIHAFARWHVLPRLHRRHPEQIPSNAAHRCRYQLTTARGCSTSSTTAAATLRDCGQDDLDAWFASQPPHVQAESKPFLAWASATSRRTATSAAEREGKKAVAAQKKIGSTQTKIAANTEDLARKRASLQSAVTSEQRSQDQRDNKRRSVEKAHAREIARLSNPIRRVAVRPAEPEKLRVLYLTASPEATETTVVHPDGTVDTTGVWLRVDRECARSRKSSAAADTATRSPSNTSQRPPAWICLTVSTITAHTSSISPATHLRSASCWTTRAAPRNASSSSSHCSHGSSGPPTLVVLNACESLAGADDLLETVPAVIGMADSIADTAAVVFAARFYAAIASAQSVASAAEQGRAAMATASLDGADLPEIRTRDDVDASTMILVVPPNLSGIS